MRHLQNGCCYAALTLLQADLYMSVHSVLRCVSRGPTSLNYVAPHHRQSPSAASSSLTAFLPRGNLCPAQMKTAPAPKCKIRTSCLQKHSPTSDSASNSSVPNSRLHKPPSSANASSMTAHPPRQKIGQDENNLQSHWTARFLPN